VRAILCNMILASLAAAGSSACGSRATQEPPQASAPLARDVLEIQNLMGRRAFYHAAGRNELEFAMFARRKSDISWGHNQGYWVGADSIRKYYVEQHAEAGRANLARMTRLYPELKNDPANVGAGDFVMHTLTTPVIEVAGDGQTAKGVWYTPGAVGVTDAQGRLTGAWLWERYAVDFIREDGQWRIWHFLVLTDFDVGMGRDIDPAAAHPGVPGAGESWDVNTKSYPRWSATTVPALMPPLPEPYRTFSETFSYGPPRS